MSRKNRARDDEEDQEFKMVIVIRSDLGMTKGKMVAQGSHACLDAYIQASKYCPEATRRWLTSSHTKIALKVNSQAELEEIVDKAKSMRLPAAIVVDEGRTQVDPDTITACAIGPGLCLFS